jgi:hypothetical protein
MDKNDEIFKGKSFADLAKDIYQNSKSKDVQIKNLISELQPLVKSIGDAVIIIPLIKEYMEIAVKNDEQIVKLAAVIQRMITADSKQAEGEFTISEEEKKQLLQEVKNINLNIKSSTNQLEQKLEVHKEIVEKSSEEDEEGQ